MGALVLMAVGLGLRHLLRLGARTAPPIRGLIPLDAEREAIYQPIALEVETQAAILGISLNDAFEERDSGHSQIAWRLVQLSIREWNRLADLVQELLKALARHLPEAAAVGPVRGIVAARFKTEVMTDHTRLHELLDQLVFSSRLRFQLHLRFLRRAAEILTAEFRRQVRSGSETEDRPEEFWRGLDLCFHDLDLICKEGLLAIRAVLSCLPTTALVGFGRDVREILGRGVRRSAALVDN